MVWCGRSHVWHGAVEIVEDCWPLRRPGPYLDRDSVTMQTLLLRVGVYVPAVRTGTARALWIRPVKANWFTILSEREVERILKHYQSRGLLKPIGPHIMSSERRKPGGADGHNLASCAAVCRHLMQPYINDNSGHSRIVL